MLKPSVLTFISTPARFTYWLLAENLHWRFSFRSALCQASALNQLSLQPVQLLYLVSYTNINIYCIMSILNNTVGFITCDRESDLIIAD